jgi:hypothetical protein
MRLFCLSLIFAILSGPAATAQVVVFHEAGFPTVNSQPVSEVTLGKALGHEVSYASIAQLKNPSTLEHARLLVLPYGSAVPVAAWGAISGYLKRGGNLLILGGEPLHVPVAGVSGEFKEEFPQDRFGRAVDFQHEYAVPVAAGAKFAWRRGYSFLPAVSVEARKYYAVAGRLDGLGYMTAANGDKLASPVISADHFGGSMRGARIVALDFDPAPGYWASRSGVKLIEAAARYAEAGATHFWIEAQYSAVRPGEIPDLTLHLEHPERSSATTAPVEGVASVELLANGKLVDSAKIPMDLAQNVNAHIPFDHPLPPGFYTVRATYSVHGKTMEYYANGFFVEKLSALETGPKLAVDGNFLSLGGKPFFPVGTNYFTTEENGWDFSGPRNALVWEHDFANMERHGVTFVRTGVWMPNNGFVESSTGGVNKRFLRNVEAYLAAAHRHHIVVNFNFFSAVPRHPVMYPGMQRSKTPPPNPYLDPASVRMEHSYVISVVSKFSKIPWLCYDLINEPSFSNPLVVYSGNVPNGDPIERRDWDEWLHGRYGNLQALAEAWSVPANTLGSFDRVPLPTRKDMKWTRYGNRNEVRAYDYNLFAQVEFAKWAHGMVEAIRSTGSRQLTDVGQDEGGVTDRVLNQFFATSGVSFTVNHTYWQDNALLWDSVVAKYRGMPNFTGETGFQPVDGPSGAWRYDEFTGQGLEERKWALGFAAGSSGALQWDWGRDPYFGIERSDGSGKVWMGMMRDLGRFAKEAEPYAEGIELPEVAIVLPQSYQMSVYNPQALHAQQTAVRVLYNYDHAPAYAVGEYQIETLGNPKLIILPSAYGLTQSAWTALEAHVRDGAVLLISGPFAADAHLHPTDRAQAVGLGYKTIPLQLRDQEFHWAGKTLPLEYAGDTTTILRRAELPDGKDWREVSLGKGKILFSALPLELNSRLDSVAAVYKYALQLAGVKPEFTTTVTDPGILICPTLLPKATLYVLTSETNATGVEFTDGRSGRRFAGRLAPGRAAILLVGTDGKLLASYHWQAAGHP